jgi:hypothetical protein
MPLGVLNRDVFFLAFLFDERLLSAIEFLYSECFVLNVQIETVHSHCDLPWGDGNCNDDQSYLGVEFDQYCAEVTDSAFFFYEKAFHLVVLKCSSAI